MATSDRRLRSDASRNHEAILTAAIAVLADAPEASMADIARASGTGRTTLYRHFPDRAALVEAIFDRVLDEADSLATAWVAAATAADDPVEVIAGLSAALAGLGDRYRFLEQHEAQLRAKNPDDERLRGAALRPYLDAGRRAGRIRDDVDGDWQFAALAGLMMAGSSHHFPSAELRSAGLASTVRALLRP